MKARKLTDKQIRELDPLLTPAKRRVIRAIASQPGVSGLELREAGILGFVDLRQLRQGEWIEAHSNGYGWQLTEEAIRRIESKEVR